MIFIEVRCDKCGSVGLSRRCFYAHQMREELKKAGWKHVAEGGKDFCPKCKPRRPMTRPLHRQERAAMRATPKTPPTPADGHFEDLDLRGEHS